MRPLKIPIDAGHGPPIVLLHGYAMRPDTYTPLVRLLTPRCRVVVPDLFAVHGRWRYTDVLRAFILALDELGLERVTLIGHSFGGALELDFAAKFPHRVVELIFSDTLAVSREWTLAREAMRHPLGLGHLATPRAITAFTRTWLTHPRQLVDAAWWAFTDGREGDIASVARAGLPAHVLWANRDSVLSRPDGREFAEELHATFTVAEAPGHIDHDWMFQQPEVFFEHLEKLGLIALAP